MVMIAATAVNYPVIAASFALVQHCPIELSLAIVVLRKEKVETGRQALSDWVEQRLEHCPESNGLVVSEQSAEIIPQQYQNTPL